jgi:hypothetical protein
LTDTPGRDGAGKNKVHAAVDHALDPAICRKMTGEINLTVVLHEGGVRAVKIGTEEFYKHPA